MSATIESSEMDLGLADEDFDLADAIEDAIKAAGPDKTWTPSEMGRKVKADSARVRNILTWLAEHQYIASYGNGAWTRYTVRRSTLS